MFEFKPDWISPPGDSIAEILEELGYSIQEFSKKMFLTEQASRDLLDGNVKIDSELAQRLSKVVGCSKLYWLKREEQYRQKLENSKRDIISEIRNGTYQLPKLSPYVIEPVPKKNPRKRRRGGKYGRRK